MESTKSPALDLHQIVTDNMIGLFEHGIIPWQRPWTAGIPMNLLSKRQYRGINLWMLLGLSYDQHYYLTWDQIKKCGGSVLKDQRGHIVLYWQQAQKTNGATNGTSAPQLRYYKVFNTSAQCRDIPKELIPTELNYSVPADPFLECESVLNAMSGLPAILPKGKAAYYDLERDEIILPKLKNFRTSESYYSILFHCLIQSTGAEKRLNRTSIADQMPFGTESYTMEALITDMGSAYLSRLCGIQPNSIPNTTTYLDKWLEVFKGDKRILIAAASHAQKAVDFILNRKEPESKDEVDESAEASVVG